MLAIYRDHLDYRLEASIGIGCETCINYLRGLSEVMSGCQANRLIKHV